ncbi:MAG: hypothetical protein Q8P78_00840 [bacterium]|nr:hypothetical protein [bacterium]
MNFLRVFALILCSVVLFVATFALVLTKSADSIAEADTITSVLEKHDLYAELEKFSNGAQQGMTITDLETDGLQATVERLLVNLFDYLKGRTNEPNLIVTVDASQISALFIERAREFPVCASGQNPWNENTPVCRPAHISAESYLPIALERMGVSMPESGEMDLRTIFDKEGKFSEIREKYALARTIWLATFAGALVFIGLMLLLCRRSLRSFMRWIGTPLFLAGGLLLTAAIVAPAIALSQLTPEAFAYEQYIREGMRAITGVLQFNGQLVTIAGVILIGASFAIPRKDA